MNPHLLRVGDKVQTNALYNNQFKKSISGTVTGILHDEDGELVFVDHSGFDVFWLELVNEIYDCKAVLYHGPGHQSVAHCERTGEHSVHFTKYGRYNTPCYWKDDVASTGFFDEPENQDGLEEIVK